MRFNKKIRKNKIVFGLSAVAIVAVATTAVLSVIAYSRSASVIENQVKIAASGVKIVEDSDAGFGKKEVSFVNEGADSPKVLLRIAYSETWSKSDGTIVSNLASNNNVVAKNWTTDFANDFVDGNDGWYYYEKTLNPEASVKVIDSISLNDSSYAIYNYDLSFRFESVQADATAANTLWGRTATIDEDTGAVTWVF
jgi:hypothetical protein